MRIQHNIAAMNAYRNYNINTSAVSKNLEKLSSGYKINRAGDDAAGLAISEKMRAQITGLDVAGKNVKDGISLVKTAEGAMQEVQDMLNRMVYLATQSANGTYDNEVDRNNLQKEVDQLRSEINRIADSANFNGIKLLDGSMENKVVVAGATDITLDEVLDGRLGTDAQAGVFELDLSTASLTGPDGGGDVSITLFGQALELGNLAANSTLSGKDLAAKIAEKWNALDTDSKKVHGAVINAEVRDDHVTFTMADAPTEEWTTALEMTVQNANFAIEGNQAEGINVSVVKEPVDNQHGRLYAQGKFTLTEDMIADGKTLKIGDSTYIFAVGKNSNYAGMSNVVNLTDIEQDDVADKLNTIAMRLTTTAMDNKNFKVTNNLASAEITLTEREGGVDYAKNNLQGATLDDTADSTPNWAGLIQTGSYNVLKSTTGLTLQIGDTSDSFNQLNVSIGDIHTDALGIDKISIGTQAGAAAAVNTIKNAINSVSSIRGTLGATQNRLEHTQNNLSVMKENIQDAESTIRDTDIAEEMMSYTKNNILVQSAQAMLAQANQIPQGVLQLLG